MTREAFRIQVGGREIVIRFCEGLEEMGACAALQVEVWGYEDGEAIPRRSFLLSMKVGGQVIGAFDVTGEPGGAGGNMSNLIGFAMSIPGIVPDNTSSAPGVASGREARAYLHSHMLAVGAEYRDLGIGRQLKLAQRRDALARGIALMEWTFDPLQIKNAFLNITRLGAVMRRYTPNFYGVSSSRLHAGLPTDRLHAEWWMDSERVRAALRGEPENPVEIQETIIVPGAIGEWKSSSEGRQRALALQSANRERFQSAFARGLAVVNFERDADGNGVYRLGPWQEPQQSLS